MRDDYRPCQRISAQSPPRLDATISRLDPPCPRVGGLLPQALVSGLQHLEVERIACHSFRRPAGNLLERLLPPGAPCPKRHIARQREVIAELESNGHPTGYAKYLLAGLELLQAARRVDGPGS